MSDHSHNPKTDYTSVRILIAIAVLCVIAVIGACGGFKPQNVPPVKIQSIEGCDLYFTVHNGTDVYFANCKATGLVATSVEGSYVVTKKTD
jgi:hypothetical protein